MQNTPGSNFTILSRPTSKLPNVTPDQHDLSPQKAASRVPFLFRTPIPSRRSRVSSSVERPPGIPFPTETPIANSYDISHNTTSHTVPSIQPAAAARADVTQLNRPPISSTTSDIHLQADFEKYANTTIHERRSRVNPAAADEVLDANGILPAGRDDKVLLSPISPCFTISDYGVRGSGTSWPRISASSSGESLERMGTMTNQKPDKNLTSSGNCGIGSTETSPERLEPKTIVVNTSRRPPTMTGGSPLRYYAMLANSENAAVKSGAKIKYIREGADIQQSDKAGHDTL